MNVAFLMLALLAAAPAAEAPRQAGVPIGKGTVKPEVRITAPAGGWTVGRMILVEGTVSDPTVDPIALSINGDRYLMRTFNGRFSRKFPAGAGKNVVTVTATNRGGTGHGAGHLLRADPAGAPQGDADQRHRRRLHRPPHLRADGAVGGQGRQARSQEDGARLLGQHREPLRRHLLPQRAGRRLRPARLRALPLRPPRAAEGRLPHRHQLLAERATRPTPSPPSTSRSSRGRRAR